ncbi:DUF998 domain-containing protein [Streptomyces montanisoli]|uniref:DUF998 domain-containing protein n=1 Tax=Streptomyces montanisoli TaxID=2798581 RepID=A0A940MBW8_9ACTN|nr:DUF998 domain-containing protein [Streptomyces montanisoli]MBP0455898.1 DUF998 domain-containing protein [Streptomyces montanisoli]
MWIAPWWVRLASLSAPVLLVCGWSIGELMMDPGYDPVSQTISILASDGAGGYWVMTTAEFALGVCYLATAVGLRAAALAGRLALGAGGLTALALIVVPAPPSGGSLRHGLVAAVGFSLLAVWPVLAARGGRPPWGFRLPVTATVSVAMWVCAAWFWYELKDGGAAGVAERVLTFAQSLWPLLAVASCPRRPALSAQPAHGVTRAP